MAPLICDDNNGRNVNMPTISAKRPKAACRRVIHVVYDDVNLLDVAGPLQVFAQAADHAGGLGRYDCVLASIAGGPITTSSGVKLMTRRLSSLRVRASDALLLPGGDGVYAAADNARLVRWIAMHATRARLVASTCTGAFLLGAAGLLEGRRAVTHWNRCRDLRERFQGAVVEEDPIFVRDGKVWTSAGVTSGIDLALALVELDLSRQTAMDLARQLVVYKRRPGGQSQYSQRLQQQVVDVGDEFESLHEWIGEHLAEDLRVERLAEQLSMSPRTFHRLYTARTGETPARAVSRARVEAARRLLEESDEGVKAVASRCGFASEEHLRRSFQRELGVSPSSYREGWAVAR